MTDSSKFIPTERGYDLWCETYDETINPMLTLVDSFLSKITLQKKKPRIAELGCGTGRNFPFFLKLNPKVLHGFDLSEGMLAQAQKKYAHPKINLYRHNIKETLPLQNKTIDSVIISMALEHLDDISRPLQETARILSDGGELIVIEIHADVLNPSTQAGFWNKTKDKKICMESFPHTKEEVVELANVNGLRLKNCFEISPTDLDIQKNSKLKKYQGRNTLLGLVFEK